MGTEQFDVLIVGAGISGIGGAAHLQMHCKGKKFAILEGRATLGGTWDLFKYPGIRSDSDMHTLGFAFKPWTHEKSIADAPSILDYLNETVDDYGLREHIRFSNRVKTLDWNSADALWTVGIETPEGMTTLQTKLLYMGTGYYRYSAGYRPEFPGEERFKGPKIHPQHWPEDLDYAGKKVIVIGSGATAATLVPAMADRGAGHVTMLQRTPTYYAIRPAKDAFANTLRKILPSGLAYDITRFKNTTMQQLVWSAAKKKPEKVKAKLLEMVQDELGAAYDAKHFTPQYNPWDQRLCLIPDADLFKAMKRGQVDIVTDQIESFSEKGILTKSGKELEADIIVIATGLHMEVMEGVALTVDGARKTVGDSYSYKGCMYGDIPNLISAFGYANASWTLKADLIAEYMCRLIKQLDKTGADIAVPVPSGVQEDPEGMMNLSSGYVERAKGRVPKMGHVYPWRAYHNYRIDKKLMRNEPIEDGWMQLRKKGAVVAEPEAELAIAAE
ncbi:MAG: NAD(P)/FAD-dependent oxidoreductase [Sphingomonadales bacterium]|nr:NAD(P)/FAD-dependent oxidoreductase [Sphingomonadales bacterium]